MKVKKNPSLGFLGNFAEKKDRYPKLLNMRRSDV
jgi:hypothetical protein